MVARPSQHAFVHYEQTPETTPKLLFEVKGEGHWSANGPKGMALDVTNGDVGMIALSWLKVFLLGDERYRPYLLQPPGLASHYETNLQ